MWANAFLSVVIISSCCGRSVSLRNMEGMFPPSVTEVNENNNNNSDDDK